MEMHGTDKPGGPQTLVGVSFENAFRAREFVTAAGGLAAAGRLELKDAATVVKDDSGKTFGHETIDLSPGRSALSGALWAGRLGLILSGPVGWAEAARFTGADLVYANLDAVDATIVRLTDAFGSPAPAAHDAALNHPAYQSSSTRAGASAARAPVAGPPPITVARSMKE